MSLHDASTGNTPNDYPKKPQILARTNVAKSRLFQIESLDLRFSNGEERQFERLTGADRGAVMIIAMP
ncbi:MAG: ADP compounds hydrolase NudE, partial [Vreelandella alkaliphila]